MSEEHLWSEWMHPYLPKRPGPQKWSLQIVERLNQTLVDRRKAQQGHTYTIKIKGVCKKCNETWMGTIESAVKPILIPILEGRPTTLDLADQIVLATWIALKVIVAEHDRDAVLVKSDLVAFMERGEIPVGMRIWIAAHDTEQWYIGYWRRTLWASLTPKPPVGSRRKNVQSTSFGVGHLFSYSLISKVPGFSPRLNTNLVRPIQQIWPPANPSLVWPMTNLSHAALTRIAESLRDFMRSSAAEWLPYPGP